MFYLTRKPWIIVAFIFSFLVSQFVLSAPGDLVNPISPIATGVQGAAVSSESTEIEDPTQTAQTISVDETEQNSQLVPEPTQAIPPQNNSATSPQSLQQTSAPVQNVSTGESGTSKIVPTDKGSDVRVIIDISGSMKQNDPENLRVPALNLIVEMLPEGAKAGVWTFGQWVNMLIPPAEVNEKWKENAKEQAQKINSHGLRTNIGEAMEKATWKLEADSEFEQHTILLTDGLVDIALDSDPEQQQKNEKERRRIMTDVLNQYKSLGVKIHTIALSDNADKVLLEKLSLETGGMSETVNNSEDLVKAFLKAFEQAAPEVAEQVPLSEDNTFEIDNSVQEFTALVFRKKGTPPTQLESPSGAILGQIKGGENAKWFSESVYDLVTINAPEAGTWKIKADLDPDNRVTVVSDLKMEIENLPNTLFPGQQIDFEVFLHEDGKVITREEFLKLMTVEMTMTAESGRSGTKVISDPSNVPKDGRYKESIKRLSKEGQYELQISVDGKTFQRMKKAYIQVRQPIGFEIRKRVIDGQEAYAVRVIPQVPDIEVARTRVIAKLKSPDQTSVIQAMPWIEEGVWETVIQPNKGLGEYKISMNVKGRFAQNQEFRIKPDPILLTFPIPADFQHEYYVQEETAEVIAPTVDAAADESSEMESQPEELMPNLADKMEEQEAAPEEKLEETIESDPVDSETPSEEEEETGGLPSWVYILIPVATLVLGIGGFFVYRMMAKKKTTEAPAEKAQESSESLDSVSLNDGMDDEDFDEDFDLSDSDDDEELVAPDADVDDLDSLDLSNDSDDEDDGSGDLEDIPDLDEPADPEPTAPSESADEVADDIPDFDENFDIDAPQEDDVVEDSAEDTAAAIDELDSVLDSLTDDDDIPQLDQAPEESASDTPPDEPDAGGESAIDEALANLESELDDIDVDGLAEDDKKEE